MPLPYHEFTPSTLPSGSERQFMYYAASPLIPPNIAQSEPAKRHPFIHGLAPNGTCWYHPLDFHWSPNSRWLYTPPLITTHKSSFNSRPLKYLPAGCLIWNTGEFCGIRKGKISTHKIEALTFNLHKWLWSNKYHRTFSINTTIATVSHLW